MQDLKKENFHWEWEPIAQESAQERVYYEENEAENDGLKERPRQARLTDTSDTENYFFSSESQNKARKSTKKANSEANRDSSEDKVNPKRDRKLNSNFSGRCRIITF